MICLVFLSLRSPFLRVGSSSQRRQCRYIIFHSSEDTFFRISSSPNISIQVETLVISAGKLLWWLAEKNCQYHQEVGILQCCGILLLEFWEAILAFHDRLHGFNTVSLIQLPYSRLVTTQDIDCSLLGRCHLVLSQCSFLWCVAAWKRKKSPVLMQSLGVLKREFSRWAEVQSAAFTRRSRRSALAGVLT